MSMLLLWIVEHERRVPYPHQLLAVAALYFVTGRLGLLLAVPPGYATPIWPPSGVALAAALLWGARIWPGILVGSFCVNVGTSFDPTSTLTILKSIGVASSIAAGASLQCVAGARLVRRFVGYPNALGDGASVVRFLVLGGPAGCLVNATWSVTTLCLARIVPWTGYPFSWATWWGGDAIGVMVVTPLALIVAAASRDAGHRRMFTVGVPLAAVFTACIVVFLLISRREQERIESRLKSAAAEVARALGRGNDDHEQVLQAIASLDGCTPNMDRATFRAFVARFPGLQALSWNPRVPDAERAAFEGAARREGLRDFAITELDSQGAAVPGIRRAEYFPVAFIEPLAGNEPALGFDIASDPARRDALSRARETRSLALTGPVRLLQGSKGQTGVLLILPTRTGFAVGVLRLGNFVGSALADVPREGVRFELYDATDAQRMLLYADPARGAAAIEWAKRMEVGGRRWELRFSTPKEYLVTHPAWEAWTVLAGGMLFTSIFGAFLLVVTGRAIAVEQLVGERTAELRHEIDERTAAEARLRTYAETIAAVPLGVAVLHMERPDDIKSFRILSINAAASQATGISAHEAEGKLVSEVSPGFYENDMARLYAEVVRTGKPREIELDYNMGRLSPGFYVFRIFPLPNDGVGVVFENITGRKKAEEQVQGSLREKEALLKEIHHRVKNNLQVVSSLLRLQAGTLGDGGAARLLADSQNRVRAMSLIHESLYRAGDLSRLRFDEYVRGLTKQLLSAYSVSTQRVELALQLKEVHLDVDRAMPCGLILNELVTNSLKHAFPNGRHGTISVHLEPINGSEVKLAVGDDGVGLPPHYDEGTTRSLGLQLVARLAGQLNAQLERTPVSRGTAFVLRIPARGSRK